MEVKWIINSWCWKSLLILILCLWSCQSFYQTDIYTGDDRLGVADENIYIYSDAKKYFNDSIVHFIIASKVVRPGQVYRVVVSLVPEQEPILVKAFLHRNNEQISSASEVVNSNYMTVLLMKVPFNVNPGDYHLKVEGHLNGIHGAKVFQKEIAMEFSERFLTILIETNQLVYNLEQTIYIRIILLTTELKPFADPVDVYLIDSNGFVMKRWVSQYPYLGFVILEFQIPYDYNLGWWKIQVKALGQTEETEILLERWFSHRYDVNVGTPIFILNTEEFYEGQILANYTSVATVTGNLTLRAFVRPVDNQKYRSIDWSNRYLEQIVDVFKGTYDFSFSMDSLRQIAMPAPLENCEIEVRADVGERFYDFMVYAYGRTRVLSTKIKLRFLGIRPQIFKPGMPFYAYLAVSYDDLVPLEESKLETSSVNINVMAVSESGGTYHLPRRSSRFDEGHVLKIEIDPPENAEKLRIRAFYEDLSDQDATASAELEVLAYYSPSKRYLQITSSTDIAQAGEYAIFHVWSNFYLKSFNYVVVSKGIVLMASTTKVFGMIRTITTFSIPVSTEMAPVFHVIVYYISPDAHIFADSVAVHVHAINKKRFVLDVNMKQDRSGNLIELVPRLSSETIVGMSGYDSDHLSTHGRRQLTKSKILEAMYTFDLDYLKLQRVLWRDREGGPPKTSYFTTHSYAQDTKQTFQNTKLAVFTNLEITSKISDCDPAHGMLQCSSGHCYFKDQECDKIKDCADGTDEEYCNISFEKEDHFEFYLHRRNRQNAFYDATAGNFAWRNKIIGEDSEEYVATTSPKGPSVYAIGAVAMSRNNGLHILDEPVMFDSTKPFLVIVEGPDTAAIGEQIGLIVAIMNYQFIEIKAEVILLASDDYRFVQVESLGIVSSYKPRTSTGELQHLVYVKPVSHLFVHIPVVATRTGDIEITIIGRTQVAKDVAVHSMKIISAGVPVHLHTSLLLDMRNEAYLLRYLDVNITEDPIIPFEETYRRYIFGSPKATVSVIGDVVGAPYPTDFTPYIGLSALTMEEPVKSGDHIMFDFAYTLYDLMYLRLTNQLNQDLMRKMLEYLNKAYVYQNVFYGNGSYSMFKGGKPSVWLTAYCTRLFHLAQYPDWENYFYVDTNVSTRSVNFILDHQTHEGSFYETTDQPWNRKMNPDGTEKFYKGYYRNVSLTAYVLIAIVDILNLPADFRVSLKNAQTRAVAYLEKALPTLKDPYQVALVTYALLKGDSVEAKTGYDLLEIMKREREGMVYWSPEPIESAKILYQNQRPFILPNLPGKYDSIAIETTSYALLVYISYGGLVVDQIVKWLNTMRVTDRAFASSQDTVIAMQALTEYSIRTHTRDITNMKVNVESSSNPGKTQSLSVTSENLAEYRTVTIAPYVWGHVEVISQGSGLSVLQLDVEYNVDKEFLLIQPPVPAFDLIVKGQYHGRNKSHMSIGSCARWTLTSETDTSGLAVIEISLPTGYFIHKPDLDRYVNRKTVPRLQRGRVYPKSAVFMFDYLDSMWSCVNFTVQRYYAVANLTRFLKAKVYDYYSPERYKEIVYEDYDLYVLNICEVCGSYQCPYCPFFSFATKCCPSYVVLLTIIIFIGKHILWS